jgi:hypothetical protein
MPLSIASQLTTPSLTESGFRPKERLFTGTKQHDSSVRFKPLGATSQFSRAGKVKEPGKNPMPGLKMTFPN